MPKLASDRQSALARQENILAPAVRATDFSGAETYEEKYIKKDVLYIYNYSLKLQLNNDEEGDNKEDSEDVDTQQHISDEGAVAKNREGRQPARKKKHKKKKNKSAGTQQNTPNNETFVSLAIVKLSLFILY